MFRKFLPHSVSRMLVVAAIGATALAQVYDFSWRGEGSDDKWCRQGQWKYTQHPLDPPPPAIYPITTADNATVDTGDPLTTITNFSNSAYNCTSFYTIADINNFTILSATRLFGADQGSNLTKCKRLEIRSNTTLHVRACTLESRD